MRLADWSIKSKLRFFTATSVAIGLVFAAVAFLVRDADAIRSAKTRQIMSLADVLSSSAVSALEAGDADGAMKALAPLSMQSSIELAVLYDAYGVPVASHPSEYLHGNVVV